MNNQLPGIKASLRGKSAYYEYHPSMPRLDVLIGSPDGWHNKHRNPPEIGKPIRVRYLDLCEGIAVRKSDLQYTLRNGEPVSQVIEWRELEVEIRDNVVRD